MTPGIWHQGCCCISGTRFVIGALRNDAGILRPVLAKWNGSAYEYAHDATMPGCDDTLRLAYREDATLFADVGIFLIQASYLGAIGTALLEPWSAHLVGAGNGITFMSTVARRDSTTHITGNRADGYYYRAFDHVTETFSAEEKFASSTSFYNDPCAVATDNAVHVLYCIPPNWHHRKRDSLGVWGSSTAIDSYSSPVNDSVAISPGGIIYCVNPHAAGSLRISKLDGSWSSQDESSSGSRPCCVVDSVSKLHIIHSASDAIYHWVQNTAGDITSWTKETVQIGTAIRRGSLNCFCSPADKIFICAQLDASGYQFRVWSNEIGWNVHSTTDYSAGWEPIYGGNIGFVPETGRVKNQLAY